MTSWIDTLGELAPPLLDGLGVTLQVMAGAAALAAPLAVVAGVGRLSTRRRCAGWPPSTSRYSVAPPRWCSCSGSTSCCRCSACNCPPCWSASWCWVERRRLWRRGGARAIRAVPPGQREAGVALNFTRGQILRRLVLPQAVPAMLPPAGNLLIELLKNTALVSLVTITDLTFRGQLLRSETLRTTEIFSLMLLMYFAVALLITAGVRLLERRLRIR